jgi:hypothetical protein
MATLQQAQTGNRVYNGAGISPNMGAVSAKGAQGYLKRSIKQRNLGRPIGGDGQSDRRSGVAQAAMQRFVGAKNVTVHNYGPGFRNGGRPMVKPNKPQSGGKPQGEQFKPDKGQPEHGTMGKTPNQQVQQPQQIKAPSVQVSANGQLNLPYNQDYANAVLQANTDYNNGLTGYTNDLNQADLDYTTQTNQANRDYQALQGRTLNLNAAAGMAFSSRYGTAVANNASDYANQIAGLQSQNNLAHQNYTSNVNNLGTVRDNTIGAAAQAYANSLNPQAGTLGYGRNPTHVNGNTNTTRYSGPKHHHPIPQTPPDKHGHKGKGKKR